DRRDKSRMWVASWAYGILEYKNDKLVATYTPSNSAMTEVYPNQPRCNGLSMDKDGNLWFAQSDQRGYLSVIKKDGSFQNFTFDKAAFARRTFVDHNNYVWVPHEREGGLTVYKPANFNTPTPGVNFRRLLSEPGTGNLGSNSVHSVAEDLDGRMWIGT